MLRQKMCSVIQKGMKSQGKHRKMCICTYLNTHTKTRNKLFQNGKERNTGTRKLYKKHPEKFSLAKKAD